MQSDEEIEIATDGHDNHVEAESLIEPPSTLHTMDDPPQQRHIRRKEVEARHFSGKENVEEHLLQFELTSKRNCWSSEDKASALLCLGRPCPRNFG